MAQRTFNRRKHREDANPYPTVEDLYKKNKTNYESAGGFIVEDEEEGAASTSRDKRKPTQEPDPDFADPAVNIDIGEVKFTEEGYPICLHCEKDFPQSFLYDQFGHPLCDPCKKETSDEKRLITRTEAKDQFLLKDSDLDRREPLLRFIARKNPHNPHWGDMKLYLRSQVWKRALEVWGSFEEMSAAKDARAAAATQRKEKVFEKKLKELRRQVRGSQRLASGLAASPHVHSFGPETAEGDAFCRRCSDCGFEDAYEKM